MRTVAIIQARMNSTRLPGKMLLPLADAPLIHQVLARTRRATRLDGVVLAYPLADHAAFAPLLKWFRDITGVALGSYASPHHENDLIARYLGAAQAYGADIIVRIPGDNPCLEPTYIDEAVRLYTEYPFVYYSNTTAMAGHEWVDGIGCEVVSRSRLQWLDQKTEGDHAVREHPHRYFEQRGLLDLPKASVRLDVNTQEDYLYVKDIYDHFGHNQFHITEVLQYLTTKEAMMSSNQSNIPSAGHDVQGEPHLSTADGKHITMPNAGVSHGGEVHYDSPTRSDSNKG